MSLFEILGTIFIGPLKLVFEIIFSLAHRITGDLGLGIIALSLIMNILLLPMYRRADAMQEEARETDAKLRDGVAHIKKVFSGDEQMMILQTYYRQNHYSPLSALNGSMSLLLEIPFFMAAYQVLSNMSAMREASFGPIGDLSLPDGLLVLWGITFNLLPIVMTAVNLLSCVLYLKGHPLKTKIQLYAMAVFFLFFLYDSPACLVFYWTLNNVFSLVKNIFYKLKNPRKVLCWLCAGSGLGLLAFTLFAYQPETLKRKVLLFGLSLVLLWPLAQSLLLSRMQGLGSRTTPEPQPDRKQFVLGALFLTVLTGMLIPGTFLAASPLEFVDVQSYYNPLWYLLASVCLAGGTFLVWCGVFYYLADSQQKLLISRMLWVLSIVMLVDYMFFGTNLGIISAELQYENGVSFAAAEVGLNLAVVAVLGAVSYGVVCKWPKATVTLLLTASLTMAGMSGVHLVTIQKTVKNLNQVGRLPDENTTIFRLSKTGKNVVVLMLDRAMGEYVPYLFGENPELERQFAGFTYYSNVLSFGNSTNFGAPALMGGYEYTPVEMNRRDSELLVEKHNEATKVMPVAFLQEGYEVTVCDPPLANYSWIGDLSIFDDYPQIKTYLTAGMFAEDTLSVKVEKRSRNFFCFSLMKTLPLVLQNSMYDGGIYNQEASKYSSLTIQTTTGLTKAVGINDTFKQCFTTLEGLPQLTAVTEEPVDTYLFFQNGTPHELQILQLPDYTLEEEVDNTAYASRYADGLMENGRLLKMTNAAHLGLYHSNMASLMELGDWFDYLREQGVYDNTRIIVVADHGRAMRQIEELEHGEHTAENYFPLLMVKDFDSQEFTTCDDFMTNADVPYLSMEGVLETPVNPFTGKPISMAEKTAHDQFVILSENNEIGDNCGMAFEESQWASVRDSIWEKENWTFYDTVTVLKEHAAP